MSTARNYTVDFPTLWIVPAWIQRHCIVPDGFRKGRPFKMYDWQLWCAVNHYRIKPEARQNEGFGEDPDVIPVLTEAFHYRRSQVVAPQKTGKGPWSAGIVCAEAVGPVLFLGWAAEGDTYECADYGCSCGWVYKYRHGEPMGHPWPTPLIQLLATSEDQVDNVYRPLQAMARGDRLSSLMLVREGFIRLPNEGKIETVTSSAMSRLGNPLNFCLQDESQLYNDSNKLRRVAETMRRGAAAMGGRSLETTNCWDPSEASVAQRTHESKSQDIFRFYEPPPEDLKYTVARDRAKIHKINYQGSPHADLNGIEGEASELAELDPAQAERFYGNRIVAGTSSWLDGDLWKLRAVDGAMPPRGTQVVLGGDGSDIDDWTGIRAETQSGYQFTPITPAGPTIWNPADYDGQVPRLAVDEAVDWLFSYFDVIRFYFDPPYWETNLDQWVAKYGEKRVIPWYTRRPAQMYSAAERLKTDVVKSDSPFTHDGCEFTESHVRNTRTKQRPGAAYYVLTKPGEVGRKIDLVPCSILCHEAAGDVTAGKLWRRKYQSYIE